MTFPRGSWRWNKILLFWWFCTKNCQNCYYISFATGVTVLKLTNGTKKICLKMFSYEEKSASKMWQLTTTLKISTNVVYWSRQMSRCKFRQHFTTITYKSVKNSFFCTFNLYLYFLSKCKNGICKKKMREKCWWSWLQVSILSMFYEQLLHQ